MNWRYIETIELDDRTRGGAVVEPGPYRGLVWVRHAIRSIQRKHVAGGAVIRFVDGRVGMYPDDNIREVAA